MIKTYRQQEDDDDLTVERIGAAFETIRHNLDLEARVSIVEDELRRRRCACGADVTDDDPCTTCGDGDPELNF